MFENQQSQVYKFQHCKKYRVEKMDKKQGQMREQITMMLGKKDYYDILGVTKAATEAQIKKAYKKLALRFHPDKNGADGAKQVFKKVSSAYTVLVNTEQRQRYDRYGPEQQQQMRQRHHRSTHPTGDDEFDDFDDIFRAFFGMNGMQMHRNRAGYRTTFTYGMGQNQQPHPQRNNQGVGFHYLFILIFLFYAISPLFKSAPYYSFNLDSQYRFRVNSDVLHTQYFVREQFFDQVKKDPMFKKQVDLQVDEQYLINLKKTCEQATRLKTTYQYKAYQYRPGEYRDYYINESKKVDLSSCQKINSLRSRNPQYISQLSYYYR